MALVSLRNDPFGGLLGLQGALERMLAHPAPPWSQGPSNATVFPPVNVFTDKEGGLVIRAEAPGVDPAKLEIDVEPQRVTIAGERAAATDRGNGFHRRERRFGRFSRSLSVPADMDPEKASASYEDGILTIKLAKAESAKPKRITVSR